MNRISKNFLCFLAASTLTLGSLTVPVRAAETNENLTNITRFWGNTRYETSVAISSNNWSNSDYVVVASGEGFADALCAAPLAKMYNAPILLSPSAEANASVISEIKRLSPKQIFIIGGTGSISDAVKEQLSKIASVERIWGMDRYETSEKVAEKLGSVTNVVVTSGEAFPDSLSIAPIAAMDKMPILLSLKDALPEVTAKYLSDKNISNTYVIGGEGVLSKTIENSVKNPTRIFGSDRYETNLAVIKNFENKLNFSNIYLAAAYIDNGGFADALSGSALAAKNSAPVVLTDTTLPAKTGEYIKTKLAASTKIVALGGQAVLRDSIVNTIVSSYVPVPTPTLAIYDKANTTYGSEDATKPLEVTTDADIKADGVTLKNANIAKDLYVHGNNSSLTNVTVKGTIYVDPGDKGTANLTNVAAANIKVLSGAAESIHFNGVNADTLTVDSKSNVRIVTTGSTKIGSTVVTSYAILDSQGGTLGEVKIEKSANGEFTVELRGTFTDTVVVETSATIKTDSAANIAKIEVAPASASDKITLSGNFKAVEVTKPAAVDVAANTKITDSIKVDAAAQINSDNSASVAKIEVATTNSNDAVSIKGTIDTIAVNSNSKVNVAAGSTVSKMQIANGVNTQVTLESGTKVQTLENNGSANVSGSGQVTTTTGTGTTTNTANQTPASGGGGGGGGDYTPPSPALTISNVTVTTSDVSKDKNATSGTADFNTISNSVKLKGLKITTSEGSASSLVISSIKVRGEEWITNGQSITTQLTNGEAAIGSLLGAGIDTGNDGISLGNLRLILGTGNIVIQGYATNGTKQTSTTTITIALGSDTSGTIPTSITKSWGKIERTGDNKATVTIKSDAGTIDINDFAQNIITVASASAIDSVTGGTANTVSLLKNALKSYISSNDTIDLSTLKNIQDKTITFGNFTVTFVIN